jgi:FMN phosphatase YigB (HAD superfamily)
MDECIGYVSFAVFGPCLVRTAGAPSEAIRAIGRVVAVRLGVADVESFAEDFIEWRREAEQRARWQAERGEPRLAEIWSELKRIVDCSGLQDIDGVALELEVERQMLRPIQKTRARISLEREAGRRILFVTDSPLPRDFITDVLRCAGMAVVGDPIYVSSELGLSKRNGTLFRHVQAAEQITVTRWCHVGDDSGADYDAAKRLGVEAEHSVYSRPQAVERLLLRNRPPDSRSWVEATGALMASRLASDRSPRDAADKLVDQFLGPFLCVFGHWILRRAAADGRKRLYFAARDGRLLHSVCRVLAQQAGDNFDLRYLYVSRQAVLFPAMTDISPAGVPWLRRDYETPTLANLLAKLELNHADCEEEWRRYCPEWNANTVVQAPLEWAAFWKLVQSPKIRARIFAAAHKRLINAQAYFTSAGLRDPAPAGFVDLGWFLTCQAGLNRICGGLRPFGSLNGYYLGLKLGRLGPAEAGEATAVFRERSDDLPDAPHLAWLRRHYLVEQVVSLADHPAVRGYGPDGKVEFATSSHQVNPEKFRRLEDSLISYVTTSGSVWQCIARDEAQTALFLGTLLNDFFAHPSRSCVEALRDVAFAPNSRGRGAGNLIQPYTWTQTLRACITPRSQQGERHSSNWRWWPEASAVATPRGRRALYEIAHSVWGRTG